MASRTSASFAALLLLAACKTPDPQKELELKEVETYYAIDRKAGDTLYISPVVRFRLGNKTQAPAGPIQASANFRRVGEESQTWGGAWVQVASSGKPLEAGKETDVILQSEGHYTTSGEAAGIFEHELYKDVNSEVFVRVGSSGWVKMAQAPIERRIGRKGVQEDP
jgi:hypothetical protein